MSGNLTIHHSNTVSGSCASCFSRSDPRSQRLHKRAQVTWKPTIVQFVSCDQVDSLSSQLDSCGSVSHFEGSGDPDHRVCDGFAERLSSCDKLGVLSLDLPSGVCELDASGDDALATMESVPQVDCHHHHARHVHPRWVPATVA